MNYIILIGTGILACLALYQDRQIRTLKKREKILKWLIQSDTAEKKFVKHSDTKKEATKEVKLSPARDKSGRFKKKKTRKGSKTC